MKEEKSLLLQFFGELPEMKIVDFLMENYLFDYMKKDMAAGAGISRVTLYKVFPKLVKQKIVVETKRVGKARFYKINKQNETVKKLYAIDFKLIEEFSRELENKQKILAKIKA